MKKAIVNLLRVWVNEFKLVIHDEGVIIFFLFLPLAYPIIYTLIYNPEVLRDIPVAVVDNSATSASRELISEIDATPAIKVARMASSTDEGRRMMAAKEAYAVIEIPSDYSRRLGRMEQTTIPVYCDVTLLLRYRTILMALTDLQLSLGEDFRAEFADHAGLASQTVTSAIPKSTSKAYFLGDTEQGFASFVIPGILILILQQSIILGTAMLAGGEHERRSRNGGFDPKATGAGPLTVVIGKGLSILTIYLPLSLYTIHYVPLFFSLPHIGSLGQEIAFLLPMLLASAFMGQVVGAIVKEREMSLVVVVFTSVVFLFLSGLTWPRYAMSPLWQGVGNLIPAVWGVEGFVRMNSNGASLGQNATPFLWMWALTVGYMLMAWLIRAKIYNRKQTPTTLQSSEQHA